MEDTSIWEVVGKIAVAITVLTGGVYLYQYFFGDPEPELVVRVDQQSYSYTPNLMSDINGFYERLDRNAVGTSITDEWLSEYDISRRDAERVEGAVLRRLRGEWPDDLPGYRYPRSGKTYSVFYRIRIDNESDYEANAVVLNLPISGIFVITQNEKTTPVADFSREIEIDRIRNDSPVTLRIWSTSNVSRFDQDEVTVSHTTGVGGVVFGKTTYGTWDALDTYLNLSGILLFLWFVLSVFFLIAFVSYFVNQVILSHSTKGEEGEADSTDGNS